jgi:Mrr N-terminal domain
MLPLLQLAADGADHTLKEVLKTLADQFGLTEAETNELLPSGQENVFRNRVSWANTYLKKAGLLRSERRGYFSITERGKDALAQHPQSIDVKFLAQFPEFQAFKGASKGESRVEEVPTPEPAVTQTPLELLETAHAKIRSELTADVLDRIKAEPASLFASRPAGTRSTRNPEHQFACHSFDLMGCVLLFDFDGSSPMPLILPLFPFLDEYVIRDGVPGIVNANKGEHQRRSADN